MATRRPAARAVLAVAPPPAYRAGPAAPGRNLAEPVRGGCPPAPSGIGRKLTPSSIWDSGPDRLGQRTYAVRARSMGVVRSTGDDHRTKPMAGYRPAGGRRAGRSGAPPRRAVRGATKDPAGEGGLTGGALGRRPRGRAGGVLGQDGRPGREYPGRGGQPGGARRYGAGARPGQLPGPDGHPGRSVAGPDGQPGRTVTPVGRSAGPDGQPGWCQRSVICAAADRRTGTSSVIRSSVSLASGP